jgi:hypothetical protein
MFNCSPPTSNEQIIKKKTFSQDPPDPIESCMKHVILSTYNNMQFDSSELT